MMLLIFHTADDVTCCYLVHLFQSEQLYIYHLAVIYHQN